METVNIDKKALTDLMILKDKFDSIIESLELMSDNEFMDSYKKSKQEIKERDFGEWNEL